MRLQLLNTGAFDVNTWLVETDRGAILVDPGEAEPALRALRAARADLAAVLLTHGHVDHLDGLPEIQRVHPAPVYLHPADIAWAFSEANALPPWYPRSPERPTDLRPLPEDFLNVNGLTWKAIPTPGHTPGSTCFLLEDHRLLFSGDTLFYEGVGRTDLPGGDADALRASLEWLMKLPPETRVLPGHGPATTIGHELRHNPAFGME